MKAYKSEIKKIKKNFRVWTNDDEKPYRSESQTENITQQNKEDIIQSVMNWTWSSGKVSPFTVLRSVTFIDNNGNKIEKVGNRKEFMRVINKSKIKYKHKMSSTNQNQQKATADDKKENANMCAMCGKVENFFDAQDAGWEILENLEYICNECIAKKKATADDKKENAQLELGDEVICLCGKKGTVIESPYDPCLTVRFEDGEIGIFVDDGSDAICNACFHGD